MDATKREDSSEGPQDDSISFRVVKTLERAWTVKCESCLLTFLNSKMNTIDLHSHVQQEIKAFRGVGLKEADHLHPAVLKASRAALSRRRGSADSSVAGTS